MNSSSRTPAPGSGSIAERAERGVAAAVAAAATVLVVVAVAAVGFAAATAAAVVASALLVVAAFVFAVVDGAVVSLAEQFFHYCCSNFDSAAACSIAFARWRFVRSPTSPPPAMRERGYSTSSLSVPNFHQLNPTL